MAPKNPGRVRRSKRYARAASTEADTDCELGEATFPSVDGARNGRGAVGAACICGATFALTSLLVLSIFAARDGSSRVSAAFAAHSQLPLQPSWESPPPSPEATPPHWPSLLPPSLSPRPPPLLRPCAWASGMVDLRELDPPAWCSSRHEDETGCNHAFVHFTDASGANQYSQCQYSNGQCVAASDKFPCPRPPSWPPPPPSPSPPSPSPPPTPLPPWSVPPVTSVSTINARFGAGHAADDLASAGVLVRVFDDLTDPARPWLPCPKDVPWLASCARFSDHFSASLIWPGHTEVYTTGRGGFVLRPEAVRPMCFYPGDGYTMSKAGRPCPELCSSPGARMWRCAWPPAQMSRGMEMQKGEDHNEMVLDAESWVRNLPRTVEAIFAIPTHNSKSTEEARQVHSNYLKEHGLTVADVPLLLYDKTKSVPFSVL